MKCLSSASATSARPCTEHISLLPLMEQLHRLIDMQDSDCPQEIDEGVRCLPLVTFGENKKTMDVEEFWHHLSTLEDFGGKKVLNKLGKFALDALVPPHSNAS